MILYAFLGFTHFKNQGSYFYYEQIKQCLKKTRNVTFTHGCSWVTALSNDPLAIFKWEIK